MPPESQTGKEEQEMEVPKEDWDRIEREIASDTSPVGIDAKKTHIIVLHLLEQIDERLRWVEEKLAGAGLS